MSRAEVVARSGSMGADCSWTAPTHRTLAKGACNFCRFAESFTGSSWTGSSRPLASTHEAPWKRASRRRGRSCKAESEWSRSGFGRSRSPEVQFLKDSLQKARRAAQERPITVLLSQTEAFVQRARKRLQAHDTARQQLVQELTGSESRLSRLQEVRSGTRKQQFNPRHRRSQTWSRKFNICNKW